MRKVVSTALSLSLFLMLFPLLLLFCFESYQPCYIFLLKGLTDNAIKNLAFCCRLLRTLNLAGCSKVTIQCVAILTSMIQWFVCLATSCLDNKFSCFTCPPILCKQDFRSFYMEILSQFGMAWCLFRRV